MPNTTLTDEILKEEVRLMLGGSAIEVELADKDITLAARRTLRVYNRYMPRRGKARLSATTTQKKYRIDDLHPGLVGVVDVEFIEDNIPTDVIDPFDPHWGGLYAGGGDTTYADLVQGRMYLEDARKISGSESEWHGQWEAVETSTGSGVYEQRYFLYVELVRTPTLCGYSYNCAYADSDDAGLGRRAIPQGDVQWFLDYTVALCKQTLARILGKHGGISGPDGQTDQTDSPELRQEATADLERLELEIKARRRPGIPLTD